MSITANLLKIRVYRLPDVNATGFEGDTRYVQIRGLSENLGTVTKGAIRRG